MPLWIPFTLVAALLQSARSACQKTLAERSSPAASALARSLFALPLAWGWLAVNWHQTPELSIQPPDQRFYLYVTIAACSQLAATLLLIRLMRRRNYAVGISYANTEAVLLAMLGLLFLNENLSLASWLAVLISLVGLTMLNKQSQQNGDCKRSWISNAAIGLLSGLGFALTSLAIRQAGISLSHAPLTNAALTLALVLSIQSLLLGSYMLVQMRSQLKLLIRQWRLAVVTALVSVVCSIGWFTAMLLENPARVKTLGQIECLFTLLISRLCFQERLCKRELSGIILVLLSVVCVLQTTW